MANNVSDVGFGSTMDLDEGEDSILADLEPVVFGGTTPKRKSAGTTTKEDGRRHRTSPRVNAFNEVLTIIEAQLVAHEGEEEAEELLFSLKEQVEALSAGVVAQQAAPVAVGAHFVGVKADGSRVHFQRTNPPKKGSVPFTSVYGPFRTKDGALYRVTNGVNEGDKKVF
jgi:hypothetical protein